MGQERLVLDFSAATLSGGITINAKNYLTFLGGIFTSNSRLITCKASIAHDITN